MYSKYLKYVELKADVTMFVDDGYGDYDNVILSHDEIVEITENNDELYSVIQDQESSDFEISNSEEDLRIIAVQASISMIDNKEVGNISNIISKSIELEGYNEYYYKYLDIDEVGLNKSDIDFLGLYINPTEQFIENYKKSYPLVTDGTDKENYESLVLYKEFLANIDNNLSKRVVDSKELDKLN